MSILNIFQKNSKYFFNPVYTRQLSSLETTMELLNQRAKTWNLVTISRIRGYIHKPVLREALDLLQYRHSVLNSHIVTHQHNFRNRFYLQTGTTEKIPLRAVINSEEKEWQEVVNQEMNQPIDSGRYLMRTVLIINQQNPKVNYLVTTLHHAIADGLSSVNLHSEIFTYYEQITSGNLLNPVSTLPPLPPPEKILSHLKGAKLNGWILLLKIAWEKLTNPPQTLKVEKYVPILQRNSQIIHRQILSDTAEKFFAQCRAENATVQSALSAAMLLTVAKKILNQQHKSIRLNCLSYFDLRRRLQPPIDEDNIGLLATSQMSFHTVTTNTYFWDLSRRIKQTLAASIQRGDIFKMVFLAKHLINFCFLFPHQIAATVSVSNIGKVNIPEIYGDLQLEEISFAGSHALYAGMFILHVATFQGKMLLNFVFSQPSLSQHTMEKLVNEFMEMIEEISHLPSQVS
ncbi:alcohol acetyltransferase [Cylindrospermopsis raciborskii LB2897]|jgi:NRPS condensation-like uncharacterized protein|uniref:phthiocerol/phthiodiolone dimycocerosyl transferase family protein n=2 Tax=Cylindrospermopsis raciborskii TaxID=77022 RepID=UPI001454CB78|nr:alcohol acetyltransferase [Cylindrospermopsis raciborskii KL1]NLQ07267.1 alcohol acetyltransferase [Cylindrospermopsis raciborskii LB2897]